jgi:hypothetical protein
MVEVDAVAMGFDDLARRMGATGPAPTIEQLTTRGSRTRCEVVGWLSLLFGIGAVVFGLVIEAHNADLRVLRYFLVPFGVTLATSGFYTFADLPPKSEKRAGSSLQ